MKTTLTRRSVLQLSGAVVLAGCSSPPPEESHLSDVPVVPSTPKKDSPSAPDGSGMIEVDGKYKVWTKKIGDGAIKVLTLHGGPGATHAYLECFEKFLPQAGIEFYYYDQLGCGFSDKPQDTSLWTLDRFRDEVEQVRGALKLDNFILYGHGFGAMLALEYALKYPTPLRKLVLSNMTASAIAIETYMHQLRSALKPDVLAKIERYEKAGQYDDLDYQALLQKFLYAQNRCRLAALPEPVQQSFKQLSRPVYNTMHGPDEFLITGNLKGWDRWADLMRIQTPTLAIGAQWDEVDPTEIEKESHMLPHGRYAYCSNGSSMCMWDDQQSYFEQLIPFLKS